MPISMKYTLHHDKGKKKKKIQLCNILRNNILFTIMRKYETQCTGDVVKHFFLEKSMWLNIITSKRMLS
jgi:hypothetical protein